MKEIFIGNRIEKFDDYLDDGLIDEEEEKRKLKEKIKKWKRKKSKKK